MSLRTEPLHGQPEALAILEAGVLECKKRDINTPEVKNALDCPIGVIKIPPNGD